MSRKRLRYLKAPSARSTIDFPIQALEGALQRKGVAGANYLTPPLPALGKIASKLGLMRRVATVSGNAYLCPIMQVSEYRLMPVCYFAETMVYCFDCWPAKYN